MTYLSYFCGCIIAAFLTIIGITFFNVGTFGPMLSGTVFTGLGAIVFIYLFYDALRHFRQPLSHLEAKIQALENIVNNPNTHSPAYVSWAHQQLDAIYYDSIHKR